MRSPAVSGPTAEIEPSREVMTAYLDALTSGGAFEEFLAPEASLRLMGSDQEVHGRDQVAGLIRFLHAEAFDAHPQMKALLVDGERAAVEADFVGRHIGEFAGKAATGKDVCVPYSVVYDLEGAQLTALRIYLSTDEIVRQLDS